MSVTRPGSVIAAAVAKPVATVTGAEPRRSATRPARGMAAMEPTAMHSSASPRAPGEALVRSLMAGIRVTQLPKTAPLRKKQADTAVRWLPRLDRDALDRSRSMCRR